MRRRIVQFGLLAALTALFLAQGTSAHAAAVQQDFPLAGTTIFDCLGDQLTITSGTSHIVVTVTSNSQGFLFGDHDNWHNVTAVDSTGTTYVGASAESFVSFSGQGSATVTQESDVLLVSQGSSPNIMLHIVMHTTILADGTVTSSVNDFECTTP